MPRVYRLSVRDRLPAGKGHRSRPDGAAQTMCDSKARRSRVTQDRAESCRPSDRLASLFAPPRVRSIGPHDLGTRAELVRRSEGGRRPSRRLPASVMARGGPSLLAVECLVGYGSWRLGFSLEFGQRVVDDCVAVHGRASGHGLGVAGAKGGRYPGPSSGHRPVASSVGVETSEKHGGLVRSVVVGPVSGE